MICLFYDIASGDINGYMVLQDEQTMPANGIEGTQEQADNLQSFRVDLTATPATVVARTDDELLKRLIGQYTASIDARVAAVYAIWMRYQAEYESREAAAQAFKDAGYTGDATIWVTGFATPAGLTPQAAADRILSQSVELRGALANLGALRMRKYEVMAATSCDAAKAAYDDICAKVDALAATIK
jgi:hypothetical protein